MTINFFFIMLGATLGAALLTLLLVPPVKGLAIRLGAVDKPNERKVHTDLKARMGGLAMYLAFWIVAFIIVPISLKMIGFFIGATFLIVVGIYDDLRDMPAKVKLLGQIIAATIVTLCGVRIEFITWFFRNDLVALEWLSFPVTLLWIVGIINAVNLIDGLDGLAAGVSAISAATLSVVAWQHGSMVTAQLCVILFGVCLGFLKYNFHPAQLFMGDTGSMFLGYTLAVLSIMGMVKGMVFATVLTPILILGIPIFDTLFAIFRRVKNSRPIFEPDKAHLHHRLLERGFSHRNTVLFIYLVSAGFSASALILNQLTNEQGFWFMVFAVIVIFLGANQLGVLSKQTQTDHINEQKKER